jgi:hypothetical protein
MRSAQPGGDWGWCYIDQAMLGPEEIGARSAEEEHPPA